MNKINDTKNKLLQLLFVLMVGLLLLDGTSVYASSDKTKPKVTVKATTTKPTAKSLKINLTATDSSGISVVKWASNKKSIGYFAKSGTKITIDKKGNASITVTKNGIYTFYAKDKAGNEVVKTITIQNIDKTKASVKIKKNMSDYTNTNVKLTLTITEEGLGINSIKYLTGKKSEKDVVAKGKDLTFTSKSETSKDYDNSYTYSAKLTVKSNNIYTFLIEDIAGNKTLKRITVDNIDKVDPILSYKFNTIKPTNKTVKVTFTIKDEDSGIKEVLYAPGELTLEELLEVDANSIKLSDEGKGSFKVSDNGSYSVLVTDNAGNQIVEVLEISNIDKIEPTVFLSYSVMNQKATITVEATDDGEGIGSMIYVKGRVTNPSDEKWETKGKQVLDNNTFFATSTGNYSVLVTDLAGNKTVEVIWVELELKGVWISYLEFANYGRNGFTKSSFQSMVDTMFDNVVSMNMNAVIVHVRPFGDAMYDSKYFPWSKYISGTQGVDPGFDPLEYMVEAAHDRGLSFHAWLNPYRVTTANTNYSSLAKDNLARAWHEDNDPSNDRNVLAFDGNLYYNPAVKEVQNLIINGIKEIINNYDVDGIHFDDYFYPVLGNSYQSNFDAKEYKAYASVNEAKGKKVLSIADWRRNNVNTLIKNTKSAIKGMNENVEFGISPGGFIDYLSSDKGYYVDYKTWLSSDEYIDYIAPQIYWSFNNSTFPYAKTLDRWLSYRKSKSVKMYVGIANYKAGSNLEADWKNDDEILKKQIEYGRDTGLVDGFMFFRYDFFYNKVTKPAVDKLLEIL